MLTEVEYDNNRMVDDTPYNGITTTTQHPRQEIDLPMQTHTDQAQQRQSLIPPAALQEFQAGVTYKFGMIEPDDDKKGNYHSPNFAGKGATVKDGAWFIMNGYRTILEFERNGKQENGKPFPTGKTFVMQVLEKPDLIPTTIHIWTFEKRQEPKAPPETAPLNTGLQRHQSKKFAKHESALSDHIDTAINAVAGNAQQTSSMLQAHINSQNVELERLRRENSQLRVDNDTLKAQNSANIAEITRLKSTFDERVAAIQATADERVKRTEETYDFKLKSEIDRMKLEEQVDRNNAIQEAVAQAKAAWDEEREEEEESLADDLEKEKKQEFAEEYRKLEKEWEKLEKEKDRWEEKKGTFDKATEFLGGLVETDSGKVFVQSIFGIAAGMADKYFSTKFPEQRQQLMSEQERLAQMQQQQAMQQQAAQQAQQAAQAANPNIYSMNNQSTSQSASNDGDEWVRTSTED